MPKVILLNTSSNKLEEFEPIDAREILASPDTIYKVPAVGEQVGATDNGSTSSAPASTSGGTLEGSDPRDTGSGDLTVVEIKAELEKRGIEYPAQAKKAEYQKLLDDAQ